MFSQHHSDRAASLGKSRLAHFDKEPVLFFAVIALVGKIAQEPRQSRPRPGGQPSRQWPTSQQLPAAKPTLQQSIRVPASSIRHFCSCHEVAWSRSGCFAPVKKTTGFAGLCHSVELAVSSIGPPGSSLGLNICARWDCSRHPCFPVLSLDPQYQPPRLYASQAIDGVFAATYPWQLVRPAIVGHITHRRNI
jgi:hypothetical protein